MGTTWSDCLELHEDLQNKDLGIDDRIQKVNIVDFKAFFSSLDSVNSTKVREECQAVNKVLKISRRLDMVDLSSCNLSFSHTKLLLKVFTDVKMENLRINANLSISPKGWLNLGRLVKQSEPKKLEAVLCNLTTKCIKKFVEGVENAELAELDISLNPLSPDGWLNVGSFIKQTGLVKLIGSEYVISKELFEKLLKGMDGAELAELDITHDFNLLPISSAPDRWLNLGIFIKQCGLVKLIARGCVKSEKDVKKLLEGMDGAKLEHFDLLVKDDVPLCPPPLQLLSLVKEELDLTGWKIRENKAMELLQKLNQEQLLASLWLLWHQIHCDLDISHEASSVKNLKY